MKCLIVDDDPDWRELLREDLEEQGFECSEAKSDSEAIRAIKRADKSGKPFRLITLDRQMERGDSAGVRVLSFLKAYLQSKQYQTVCVVISGASSDKDVRDYFMQYNVCDYISKGDDELWEKLKHLTDKLVQGEEKPTSEETIDQDRQKYLTRLRQILTRRFDEGGLRTLCVDLGIDYDDLPDRGKANKARELIQLLERTNRIDELVEFGKQSRPDIPWNEW